MMKHILNIFSVFTCFIQLRKKKFAINNKRKKKQINKASIYQEDEKKSDAV